MWYYYKYRAWNLDSLTFGIIGTVIVRSFSFFCLLGIRVAIVTRHFGTNNVINFRYKFSESLFLCFVGDDATDKKDEMILTLQYVSVYKYGVFLDTVQ